MIYILDDVLEEDLRSSFLNHSYNDAEPNGLGDFWHNQKYDNLKYPYVKEILSICQWANCADLSSMVGYEMHHNYSDYETFHVDKDELLYEKTGEIKFPIVGIAYYPLIENLTGGTFYIEESVRVTPKTNRLIIFSSDLPHGVSPVLGGTRISVGINAWNKVPLGY